MPFSEMCEKPSFIRQRFNNWQHLLVQGSVHNTWFRWPLRINTFGGYSTRPLLIDMFAKYEHNTVSKARFQLQEQTNEPFRLPHFLQQP